MRAVSIATLILLLVPHTSGCQSLELRGRLQDWATLEHRAQIHFGQTRLVLIDVRSASRPDSRDRTDLGISSPWLVAGPVDPAGLLRQIHNPTGYDAGSAVLSEPSGLVLDTTFDGGRRHGAQVSPWPGQLGVFCLQDDVGRRFGLTAAVGGTGPFELHVDRTVSHPSSESPPETWYWDEPPFPGGLLLIQGARLAADTPLFDLCLSGATSGGDWVPVSGFATAAAGLRLPTVHVDVLGALASPEYRTPAGERSRYGRRVSGSGHWEVARGWTFLGSYRHRLEHRPSVYRAGVYREGDESLVGGLSLRSGRRREVELSVAAVVERDFRRSGDVQVTWGREAGIEYIGPHVEGQMRVETPDRGRLTLRWVVGGISWTFAWDQRWEGDGEIRTGFAVVLPDVSWEIDLELGTVMDQGRFGVMGAPLPTLGWKTQAGMGARARRPSEPQQRPGR